MTSNRDRAADKISSSSLNDGVPRPVVKWGDVDD